MREVELVEHRRIDGLHVFFNTLEYRTPHCHREIELLLVLEGRLAIPGAAQEAASGDMALFGANQTHELRALGGGCTFLCLQAAPELLERALPAVRGLRASGALPESVPEAAKRRLRGRFLAAAEGYFSPREDGGLLCVGETHLLLRELAAIRREGTVMPYLRPDAKSQVTVEYGEDRKPVRIHTIVVSTQHDEFVQPADGTPEAQEAADRAMHDRILADVRNILLPRVMAKLPERVRALFDDRLILLVNPTGKFVIGGPHGDTGLTGRKIIVDTYGGRGAHGGGAFSGKDPSKVDRSAAYAVRHIAKNAVAAGIADEMLVQVAYAIGCAEPVSLYVSTFGTKHVLMTDAEIAERFTRIFDLRPSSIVRDLKLLNPIYEETAAYGHVGREPQVVEKHFHSKYEGDKTVQVELFTWEKLDYVDRLKAEFGL